MKRGLWFLLALGAAGTAGANDLFSRPATAEELQPLLSTAQETLRNSQALRGRFEQRKFLADLPKPLVSEGEFTFGRDRGIWWHTHKPFESQVVLTRAGMIQTDAGGAPVALSAEQQPALRVIADVFLSLFALDLRLLAENFVIHGVSQPGASAGSWALGLTPHAGALGGMVKRVTIHGGPRVERIELEDAHGDRTVITLRDDGRGSGPLTPIEAARFELPELEGVKGRPR